MSSMDPRSLQSHLSDPCRCSFDSSVQHSLQTAERQALDCVHPHMLCPPNMLTVLRHASGRIRHLCERMHPCGVYGPVGLLCVRSYSLSLYSVTVKIHNSESAKSRKVDVFAS